MTSLFKTLYQCNVNDHVEKKGKFSYLSWPYAVAQLRLADDEARWEVRRFDGLPYCKTETGYFVEVAVTLQGVTLSQIHPVLDARNNPLLSPTAFDINTSIQRCLVKAIALHGLGLYIYAGEDLPGDPPPATTDVKEAAVAHPAFGPKLSPLQIAAIERQLELTKAGIARLLAYYKVRRLTEIPADQYDRVMRSLAKYRRTAA